MNINVDQTNSPSSRLKTQSSQPNLSSTSDKTQVINLSDIYLDYATESIVKKGLNFAITPNKITVEEVISNIEVALKNLDIKKGEEIRQDIAKISRTSKPPASNISLEEKRALNNLRKNKNIVILKADKGNATVIMNRIAYDNKMEDHLNNSGCYKIIDKDPSEKVMREVIKKIKESSLDDITKKKIIPNSAITPRIYGAPKVHKSNIPLRPIVSTIGSPTYLLEKHLAKRLRPLSGNTPSYIKDSYFFLQ